MGAVSPYRNIWRSPYEAYASIAWFASAVATAAIYGVADHNYAALFLSAIAGAAGVRRFSQARKLIGQRVSIAGAGGVVEITRDELLRVSAQNPDGMFLGKGWEWQPRHTKLSRELAAKNAEDIKPIPKWMLKVYGKNEPPQNFIGDFRIHGLEPKEDNIYALIEGLKGHTMVAGTTGTGKTRLYQIIVTQAIHAGAVVIVIDPKGDRDLKNTMERECKAAGRPFLFFHPAFPGKSIRFDPLKSWNNPSEIASRIAQLLGESDSFVEFAHLTIDRVVNGLLAIGIRPSLRNIMELVQDGVDKLLDKLLDQTLLELFGADWEKKVSGYVQKNNGAALLDAKVNLYAAEVRTHGRNNIVDGLISILVHNKEHYGKMILKLLPLLQMLTSGEIGGMLSPDYEDIDDPRPIYDSEKIIEGDMVFYMGLDSLSNKQVGSAIGSITLADFSAVAGAIYNFGKKKDVYLLVDEANEAMNDQYIQILNKGRDAGFFSFFSMQTTSDIEVRLGSRAKGNQAIGNANNVIALRLRDTETTKYISDMFETTTIQKMSVSQSNRAESESHIMEFGGTVTRAMKDEETNLMPSSVLRKLPNLHFVALAAGGRLYKGRIPLIIT